METCNELMDFGIYIYIYVVTKVVPKEFPKNIQQNINLGITQFIKISQTSNDEY